MLLVSCMGPQTATEAQSLTLDGQVIVTPGNPRFLARYSASGPYTPFMIAGAGDPEDFLHQGTKQADGTRSGGNQQPIIDALKASKPKAGVSSVHPNSMYFQAIRSHGGDGASDHNPFIVPSNPWSGVDTDILNQWDGWITQLDNENILTYFFFFDDGAAPFGNPSSIISGSSEDKFIRDIVNKLETKRHIIWSVAEEYSEAMSNNHVTSFAARIRYWDDYDHPIAVHQVSGNVFNFPNAPNIDQFALQVSASNDTPAEMNSYMTTAWNNAAGKYGITMAECATWHKTLMTALDRTNLRKSHWAVALTEAGSMVIGMWTTNTPTTAMLNDLARVHYFMTMTDFQSSLVPNNALRAGSTDFVFANAGVSYILYSDSCGTAPGLTGMTTGTWKLKWFDPIDGDIVNQTKTLGSGTQTFQRPSGIGNECAVWVRK